MQPILYTTPSCPKCQLAKHMLAQAKIEYTLCEDVQQAIKAGVTSAPTLVIGAEKLTLPAIISYCKGGGQAV